MARITYAPTDEQVAEFGLPETTDWFGLTFDRGKPVEVENAKVAERLSSHRFFKGEAVAETADDGLKAEHHGGGKFRITQGEDILLKGLSKADADAFNALSDEDKAAYVEAHKVAE